MLNSTNLSECELLIDKQSQNSARYNKKYNPEGIVLFIVGAFVFHTNLVDDVDRRGKKDDFHHGQVKRNTIVDNINISGDEYKCKKFLGS